MQHRATPAKGLLGNGVHKCAMKHRPPNGAQVGQRGKKAVMHGWGGLISSVCSMDGIFHWGVDEEEKQKEREEEEREGGRDPFGTKIGVLDGVCIAEIKNNEWI